MITVCGISRVAGGDLLTTMTINIEIMLTNNGTWSRVLLQFVFFYDFMGDVYYYKSVGWVTPLATTCKGKIISGNSFWVEKLAQRKQPPFDFSEVLNLDLSAPPKI